MRLLLLTFTLLAAPALAGDFRDFEFGKSCADVKAHELSIGSQTDTTFSQDPDGLHFRGKAFDREAFILYLCPGGVLFGGSLILPAEPLSTAKESYLRVFRALIQTYGAPSDDQSPGRKSPYPQMPPPEEFNFMTTWMSPRLNMTMSMWRLETDEPNTWRVFVMYANAAGRERSNTSLERTRER